MTVYAGCRLGARVIVHAGAVIGADGFGMAQRRTAAGSSCRRSAGSLIGDDVEIGANTTIDRGTVDDTVIEEGVKLDNQIQIGHNCRIGAHTRDGRLRGRRGQRGDRPALHHRRRARVILGHLSLCDGVHVSAGTVISRSIRKPGTYTGMFPFDDNASWARNTALVRHLAELAERVACAGEAQTQEGEGRNG